MAPVWLARAAAAPSNKRRKVLVTIFQRGAADGLNMVVPFAEKRYYDLRPSIGIQAPRAGGGANQAIDLDGHFALHQSLQPFKELWENKMLAIVDAVGSPDPSRSHFDAQDYMESGTPGSKGDGWLNRALPPKQTDSSPLRAVSLGATLPRTLRGDQSAIAVGNLEQFSTPSATASIVEKMYATTADASVGTAGKDAFAAMRMLDSLHDSPTPGGRGPGVFGQGGDLGRALQQVARLIKSDAGVEAAFAEVGGWDHHQNEPNQMANGLRQFSAALAAFCKDMGDRMEDIVIVTMSEFGRTARENGNNGTDHGHGSVMFVIGGQVKGGKVYGEWPGLEEEQLYEKRDLAVTTDFREVLSELVAGQFGTTDLGRVFPGFKAGAPLGLLKTGPQAALL
jgi:uncharacterized protein (DUF1501 family)